MTSLEMEVALGVVQDLHERISKLELGTGTSGDAKDSLHLGMKVAPSFAMITVIGRNIDTGKEYQSRFVLHRDASLQDDMKQMYRKLFDNALGEKVWGGEAVTTAKNREINIESIIVKKEKPGPVERLIYWQTGAKDKRVYSYPIFNFETPCRSCGHRVSWKVDRCAICKAPMMHDSLWNMMQPFDVNDNGYAQAKLKLFYTMQK